MFTEIEDFPDFDAEPIPKKTRKSAGRVFRVQVETAGGIASMSVICMTPQNNEDFAANMVARFGRDRLINISNT